jgi:hypothetical protein
VRHAHLDLPRAGPATLPIQGATDMSHTIHDIGIANQIAA